MRKAHCHSILLTAFALLSACSGGGHKDVIMLNASTTASAIVGETLVVNLAMNAGTGYQWRFTGSPESGAIAQPKFDAAQGTGTEKPTTSDRVGGPVECVFEFAVTAPGTATLSFELSRQWEKGQPPADRRVLTLAVAPAAKN